MRAHYLQHVPFEGLGSIRTWLNNNDYKISSTKFFNSKKLPEIENIDLLIVMGGPMSVNDKINHPWLVAELQYIKDVIQAGKPVIGICLGAQLIAKAMGAEVFPAPIKEIGWFPIGAVKSQNNLIFKFPDILEVFHWHGETFSLPKGAIPIAKSKNCENQAFQIGSNVIGLQFHLETTPKSAQAIIENCRAELIGGKYIQSEAEILSAPQDRYSSINKMMEQILKQLHKTVT